jgi:hypothetical protein
MKSPSTYKTTSASYFKYIYDAFKHLRLYELYQCLDLRYTSNGSAANGAVHRTPAPGPFPSARSSSY